MFNYLSLERKDQIITEFKSNPINNTHLFPEMLVIQF